MQDYEARRLGSGRQQLDVEKGDLNSSVSFHSIVNEDPPAHQTVPKQKYSEYQQLFGLVWTM